MGFDLRTCYRNATGLYPFIRALARYSRMNRESAFRVRLGDLCPILSDWHASARQYGWPLLPSGPMGCKEDLRKKALAPHRHRLWA